MTKADTLITQIEDLSKKTGPGPQHDLGSFYWSRSGGGFGSDHSFMW